jgi:c-di-GMP-binding flagellar brake protein YcgR
MSLKSLVYCSDEKIVRVLRRVLCDLEISVEHCGDSDSAIHKLTRQRFESVIVDCDDLQTAAQVLRSARSAPCNKRAIAVAIVDGQTGLKSAFEMGAHFVLYKPVSTERAKASFRAARALMKRERRRNTRVAVEMPITLLLENGPQRAKSADLSEGGMAIEVDRRPKNSGSLRIRFTVPGTQIERECPAEIAWETSGRQVGLRFVDMPADVRSELKAWLVQQSPEAEQDDPPVACKLTDLSLGGCYLELPSPFPVRTRVTLSMKVGTLKVQVEGAVRVMHPENGMGVEFTQRTEQQREGVERFIQTLMKGQGAVPELTVAPDGLEIGAEPKSHALKVRVVDDPLIDLFAHKAFLPADAFLAELKRQRTSGSEPAQDSPAL